MKNEGLRSFFRWVGNIKKDNPYLGVILSSSILFQRIASFNSLNVTCQPDFLSTNYVNVNTNQQWLTHCSNHTSRPKDGEQLKDRVLFSGREGQSILRCHIVLINILFHRIVTDSAEHPYEQSYMTKRRRKQIVRSTYMISPDGSDSN